MSDQTIICEVNGKFVVTTGDYIYEACQLKWNGELIGH